MKIELDFSSRVELLKTRRELEMAIVAIDSAVKSHATEHVSVSHVENKPRTNPAGVIDALPETFNTREARTAATAAGVSEQRIRNEIARQIDNGTLKLTEVGKGTTPSTFIKIKKSTAPKRVYEVEAV